MSPERSRHVMCTIPAYPKSFALLSGKDSQTVRRAVIFIHGLNGSARSTWTNFVGLIDNGMSASPWWDFVDLYFFDYQKDSVFRQASRNALRLNEFIESIWPNPNSLMSSLFGDLKRDEFAYKELTLVGHSEGGLLIRKVILEVAKTDKRLEDYRLLHDRTKVPEPEPIGMLNADLRLFAPAIAGEALSGLKGILVSLPIVRNVIRASAAKQSLGAESASVTTSRDATDDYTEYLQMGCFRAHILWADDDNVVTSESYQRDLVCRNLPSGTTHTSICKPNWGYKMPIEFVEKGVIDGKC
jgi:hypothetical protein